jgi:hypothetical protein
MKKSKVLSMAIVCFVSLLAVTTLAGCGARMHKLNDNAYWFDYNSDRRGAVLTLPTKDKESIHYCAERFVDVAKETAAKGNGQVEAKDATSNSSISASGSGEYAKTVVDLTKRSQATVVLSEALYRICEISMTGDNEALRKDQLAVVDKAVEMYKAEAEKEVAIAKAQAEADAKKAEAAAAAEKTKQLLVLKDLDDKKVENVVKAFDKLAECCGGPKSVDDAKKVAEQTK